jgi:HD-like signal output (HDOD) protein
MSSQPREILLKKLDGLDRMPSIPAVLTPLLNYLEQPIECLQIQRVVDLISQDKSLAAQCLHMANSPLYGRYAEVGSVRDAVVALGMQRMRDIAVSCSVLKLFPGDQNQIDPIVFWEHSMGCALVCRHFAQKIGFPDAGKAYLAGLLHDLGILVNLWILPKEFGAAIELARREGIPLHEAEFRTLGLTHCESGELIAERWGLTADLAATIRYHHEPQNAPPQFRALLALISLSDLLCRMENIGHGYAEERQVDFVEEPAFALLLKECPALETFDWARFTFELESYLDEVQRLVNQLYRSQ